VVQLYHTYKLVGQGYRSEFKVTGGNVSKVVGTTSSGVYSSR